MDDVFWLKQTWATCAVLVKAGRAGRVYTVTKQQGKKFQNVPDAKKTLFFSCSVPGSTRDTSSWMCCQWRCLSPAQRLVQQREKDRGDPVLYKCRVDFRCVCTAHQSLQSISKMVSPLTISVMASLVLWCLFYGEWVKILTKVTQEMKLGPKSSGRFVVVCFFWNVSGQSFSVYFLIF